MDQLAERSGCFSPDFTEIRGEYKAQLVSPDVFANYYADHMMGPGEWEGKGLFPFEEKSGWGI